MTVRVYYNDGIKPVYVGNVITDQSITIDQALQLIGFNEDDFLTANNYDEIDYNDFIILQ